jgi:NADPH-dependent 7-cyano-7-deazaguanine reductase QueF
MNLESTEKSEGRRSVLTSSVNPNKALDYITVLSGHFVAEPDKVIHDVRLRYVPGSFILHPQSWQDYLKALCTVTWDSMEHTAVTMVGDTNDHLVPRWIEISLTSNRAGSDMQVIVDDREPGWHNENILARLDSF